MAGVDLFSWACPGITASIHYYSLSVVYRGFGYLTFIFTECLMCTEFKDFKVPVFAIQKLLYETLSYLTSRKDCYGLVA